MGEIQRHAVTHHLSPELSDLLRRAVAERPTLPDAPEPAPAGPHVEPWEFYSPKHGRPVTAFLDPENQIRHVAAHEANAVPKTWRRIYLGDPRP